MEIEPESISSPLRRSRLQICRACAWLVGRWRRRLWAARSPPPASRGEVNSWRARTNASSLLAKLNAPQMSAPWQDRTGFGRVRGARLGFSVGGWRAGRSRWARTARSSLPAPRRRRSSAEGPAAAARRSTCCRATSRRGCAAPGSSLALCRPSSPGTRRSLGRPSSGRFRSPLHLQTKGTMKFVIAIDRETSHKQFDYFQIDAEKNKFSFLQELSLLACSLYLKAGAIDWPLSRDCGLHSVIIQSRPKQD